MGTGSREWGRSPGHMRVGKRAWGGLGGFSWGGGVVSTVDETRILKGMRDGACCPGVGCLCWQQQELEKGVMHWDLNRSLLGRIPPYNPASRGGTQHPRLGGAGLPPFHTTL